MFVSHPQANRQVKANNKQIMESLKAKVDRTSGKWVDTITVYTSFDSILHKFFLIDLESTNIANEIPPPCAEKHQDVGTSETQQCKLLLLFSFSLYHFLDKFCYHFFAKPC